MEPGALMSYNTRDLCKQIKRIDAQIERMEARPESERAMWAPTLQELRDMRLRLRLLLINREVEAAKKVVDFRGWRDGTWPAAQRGKPQLLPLATR